MAAVTAAPAPIALPALRVAFTVRDLLAGCTRIVVCAPHPDDEVLGCGGLLALAAASGVPCAVVSVTDGEACYPEHPQWTAERLRTARVSELHDALDVLGQGDCRVLRLAVPDGEVESHHDLIVDALNALLQPGDAVFVTASFDGHPDHEGCAAAARAAAEQCGARVFEYPVWAGDLNDADVDDAARDTVLLVLPPAIRERKAQAIRRFASQTGSADASIADPILPPHVCDRFLQGTERFFR